MRARAANANGTIVFFIDIACTYLLLSVCSSTREGWLKLHTKIIMATSSVIVRRDSIVELGEAAYEKDTDI